MTFGQVSMGGLPAGHHTTMLPFEHPQELWTNCQPLWTRRMNGRYKGSPNRKGTHAHRLFQCLVAAIRPLRVEELAEVFTIEFNADTILNLKENWRPENAEEAVLSACSTLISVIEYEGSKIVQFSHFSVKEFLTSDRIRSSEDTNIRHYYSPLDSAHTILARACLAVLLQLDDKVDKKRLASFPLAFYAAENCIDHIKYGDVASRVQGAVEQLFDPSKSHLAAWIGYTISISMSIDDPLRISQNARLRPMGLHCTMRHYVDSAGWQSTL
jgi:hypothetical protein